MILEAFQPEHLYQIDLQEAQRSWYMFGSKAYARELARGHAYTVRAGDEIMVCGGVLSVDQSTGHLWCFMSRNAYKHILALTRVTQRFMQVTGKKTLHATTEMDFPDGCRWLRLLGFKESAMLHGYGPDGRDHMLYTKVL